MHRSPSEHLRVLVIADSKIPVPPHGYGGAERFFAHLCEGMQRRGHEVTLMAAEGSRNYSRLVTYPWIGNGNIAWRGYCKINMLMRSLRELTARHDVIIAGCKTSYLTPFLLAGMPVLYRFGNPIDRNDVLRLTNAARGALSFVSVSNRQRVGIELGSWHTIYNGADTPQIPFASHAHGNYLAFIGRLTANKGADTAIRIAQRMGLPLKLAGNVSDEPGARAFFEKKIQPYLTGNIEWIGEIGDDRKFSFLSGAKAVLAPIRWDEPCANIVMESLACGTPVIATPHGCMPELIRDGTTGFLAHDDDELVQAITRIDEISRHRCRDEAERRFSTDNMIDAYLHVARTTIASGRLTPTAVPTLSH